MKINKKQIAIYIVIAIVFTAAGYYANSLYRKQQQDAAAKVAKSFISDLTAGNTAGAYNLGSAGLKTAQNQADFTKGFAGLKTSKPTYQTSSVLVGNGAVIYQQKVGNMPPTDSGSTEAAFSITLVSNGGSWKVDNAIVQ
jgi:hypothetical protein